MTLTFFWYPKCGTCLKAKKWFDEHQIDHETIHIVENPPTKEQLREFVNISKLPMKKFFNTSGVKYRELGLKDKLSNADEEDMLNWLSSDGMLIKRPIVTDGKKITVGFKEENFDQTWK